MSNHPNRSKGPKGPAANPTPEEIKAAREAAGLSQSAAGALVYRSLRNWQQWEGGERRMDPALWELFRLKAPLNNVRT
jgi:DNA-binding transcriptional regulator YiaG